MNARMIALAALVSGLAGSLTGCGQVAPSLGVPVAAQAPDVAAEVVSTQSGNLAAAVQDDYSTQGVSTSPISPKPMPIKPIAPAQLLFAEDFEKATQESLGRTWQSYSDYRGPIPMIYPAPSEYQVIRPGLGGSKQAVASGGGRKAFATHRNFLQLRQVLTASRGFEGASRTLTFRYTPFVNEGPTDPRMKRPNVQVATAPLQVEVSADGKSWKRLWDSSLQAIPMIYPAPTELGAKVSLPAGKLNLRFVTVAKAGQVTPRLDDVRVMQDGFTVVPWPMPLPSVR
ncbi:MAG: hypothetical protein VKP72_04750 [bacterium]|nr:hypothetical protein [bacterium]